MRWSAIGERVQKKSEALAPLLFIQSQEREHARLQLLAVNPDAARAQLRAVQHQVVALRAHVLWSGFKFVDVFFANASEGMLCRGPALFAKAPFKKGKAGQPQKFPAIFGDKVQPVAERQPHLPPDQSL